MLAVNCAALSENLLRIGTVRPREGAFTGADRLRRGPLRAGRWRHAAAGRDQRDRAVAPGQAAARVAGKSVRARRQQHHAAGGRARRSRRRNRDLEREVDEGKFRQDLFYRLNVVPIDLPPLRKRHGRRAGTVPAFPAPDRQAREPRRSGTSNPRRSGCCSDTTGRATCASLQNIIERACVLETEPGVIRAATIEPWLRKRTASAPARRRQDLAGKPLADIEKQVISQHARAVQGSPHQDRRRPWESACGRWG